MSERLEVVRALVTERLSAAAEEIFQLFVRTLAEYELEQEALRAKGPRDRRVRAPGGTEEAQEEAREEAGVSSFETEIQAQIYIKQDPDLCLKQEPEEPLPLAAVSVQTDKHVSVHRRNAERNAENEINVEFGHAEESLTAYFDKEGHSDAFVTGDSHDAAETGQTFYFSDLARSGNGKVLLDETHKKETKQHKCAQCGKVYLHRPSLFRHILTHKEQKPFKCSVCQKGFSQKPHLTVHMRIHTGEKPFSCPFCAKTFSNKSNVRHHLRVHTGEKPFACSVCDARFRCAKTLSGHMAAHAGERPFGCSDCGARYKQQSGLDAHRRTHSGEKPYGCPVCGAGFSQRQSLTKHLQLHAKQGTPSGEEEEVQEGFES